MKTYSLATLEAMCARSGGVNDTLPWHELRADKLWLRPPPALLGSADVEVYSWHSRGDRSLPALPIPFTARDLAAFMLAGGGLFLYERFADDEEALDELDRNATSAAEAMREALRLRQEANSLYPADDQIRRKLHDHDRTDEFARAVDNTREAASWLVDAPNEDDRGDAAVPTRPVVGNATTSTPDTGRRVHRTRRRADALGAVIAMAKETAVDASDWTSVWSALVVLAQRDDPPAPLIGYVEGEGVKYQTDSADEPVGWFNREALRGRLRRAK